MSPGLVVALAAGVALVVLAVAAAVVWYLSHRD